MSFQVAKNQDDVEALLEKGGELLRLNRVEKARETFHAALEKSPRNEKVLGLLGLTHFRLADFRAAEDVYQTLIEENPKDASYRLNLGLVHLKLGHATRAIEELTRARELDPSQIRTVSYLGLAYARNGEYGRAYEAFLRADQSALAAEMEQYLDEDARRDIRELVLSGEGRGPATEDTGSKSAVDVMFGEPNENALAPSSAQPADGAPEAEAPGERVVDDTSSAPSEPSEGMITRALDVAIPSSAASAAAGKLIEGHQPPRPLSDLATRRLIRPDEGDEVVEIGVGGVLIVRVRGQLFSRTQRVIVSAGDLAFEVATRRVRGAQTTEVFGEGEEKVFSVSGDGYLVAAPGEGSFTAVRLDEDALYVREPMLYAFEPALRWESGRVPGSDIRVVQFRGSGCVALHAPKPLLSVRISSERVIYVDSDVMAGWIGRVVPRLVKPTSGGAASTPFVECSGEGVVLIEEQTAP